jgi:adenylate cyclase
MIRNLSIGKKIVGLSVVLLSVMLGASVYSFVQAIRVRDASSDITGTLLPVSAQLSGIETNTLEQALMLERANRHSTTEEADPERAKAEMARFSELNTQIESQIGKAEQFIDSALGRASVVEDAVQLARLGPELEELKREHDQYAEAALALMEVIAKRPSAKTRGELANQALKERLSQQEDMLDDSIARLSVALDSAEMKEAAQLSSKERRAYLVSMESLMLAVASFLAGTIVSAIITRRLVRPVQTLISGAEEVARGNLDVTIRVRTQDEIGKLAVAFQKMVVELRSKARIKETFGKYMDPRVVERLLGDGQQDFASGEKRVMTVFFSDLQGFSTISESLTAAGLIKLINSYLTLASGPIVDHKGVIDKYIGDAIMAFWGPPFYTADDHAKRACLASLAQSNQLVELKRILPDILGIRKNLPDMHVRIGLCTGELIVGSIGSHISKSFTVMGDTVNTASRLESVNKQFGTGILMDGKTFEMVKQDMEARQLDLLGVVGKSEPVLVYELLGEKGKVEAARLQLRDTFEAGLRAYHACDWDTAEQMFELAAKADPADGPSTLYRERVRKFRATPPPAGWDGVWRLTEK